jgi:starch phosphorylase
MSSSVFALQVSPSIPAPLKRLDDLAKNFWFAWNPALGQVFRKLDPILWRKVEGSPRLFLRSVDQSILDHAATDAAFIEEYRQIVAAFDDYLGATLAPQEGLEQGDLIAYFCAEYGWHESFPIYSGGLGVLAGDHCKTASDLKLPFVAVGLLYRHGYFHQRLTPTSFSQRA